MAGLAKIGILPKDGYSPSTAYKVLDMVRYNNSLYIAKRNTTGNAPTNTTYWMLAMEGVAVSNSAAVTEAGIALDARQANPAVANSLGAQIATLNGNTKLYKIGANLATSDYLTIADLLAGKLNRITYFNFYFVNYTADNPFTFEKGFALAFHSSKLFTPKQFLLLGIDSVGLTTEVKMFVIPD